MSGEKKYWLDQRRNIDRLFWGLVIVCVILGLADLVWYVLESIPTDFSASRRSGAS
jgi:hypothetical protein